MRRIFLLAALLAAVSCGSGISWERHAIVGERTGVGPSSADNVAEKMGVINGAVYTSPNGRTFNEGSATYGAAKLLIEAQPAMAELKQVVGHSAHFMTAEYPQSELSNWFIDELMRATEELSGKKVQFGLTNFGGIRVDMPDGDVLMDDIVSMFPFKNNLCYLELKGRDIRVILEQLAATRWQVVGGGEFVVHNNKLESAIIDGEPLDDDRTYGVATISFLLNGGDDIYMARNAVKVQIFDEYILDVMLPYVQRLEAEGKLIEYHTDNRIKIIND